MKICILKQKYDIIGSFSSYIFEENKIKDYQKFWLNKSTYYETHICFKADTYITEQIIIYNHIKDCLKNNKIKEQVDKYTKNVYKLDEIPYEKYDIIWTRDAFLTNIDDLKLKYPNKLFVYEMREHTEHISSGLEKTYDYLLNHTTKNFNIINHNLTFPYTRCPDIIRNIYNCNDKEPIIYIDAREIEIYYKKNKNITEQQTKDFLNKCNKNLNKLTSVSNSFACQYLFSNRSNAFSEKSTIDYYNLLSKSKYYISLSRPLGQAISEAASFGCIVISTTNTLNSQLICHQKCISNDSNIINICKNIINPIEENIDLQNEILDLQNEHLKKNFVEYPKNTLKNLLEIKRS